jgi:hypothetical protein
LNVGAEKRKRRNPKIHLTLSLINLKTERIERAALELNLNPAEIQ